MNFEKSHHQLSFEEELWHTGVRSLTIIINRFQHNSIFCHYRKSFSTQQHLLSLSQIIFNIRTSFTIIANRFQHNNIFYHYHKSFSTQQDLLCLFEPPLLINSRNHLLPTKGKFFQWHQQMKKRRVSFQVGIVILPAADAAKNVSLYISIFFPFLPKFSRLVKWIPNLLIALRSTFTKCQIRLFPHTLIGAPPSSSGKSSVTSTKQSSSSLGSLLFLLLFYK